MQIYISEITPTELRGMLSTLSELSLTCGVVLLYGLGSTPGIHYYDLALVHIAILAFFMFLVVWIPETPRWLLLKLKDKKRAVAVLKYLMGPENRYRIAKELNEIEKFISAKELNTCQKLRMIFSRRSGTLVPFLLIIFVYAMQQLCGGTIIILYASQIFLAAGAPNPNVTSIYAIGGSLVLGTVLVSPLVERLGRKILLVVSTAGMFAGCFMLGVNMYLIQQCSNNTTLVTTTTTTTTGINDSEINGEMIQMSCNLLPLAIASVLVYVFSFSFGLGPIPWVLFSEYLPLQVRGLAGGLVVAFHWINAALVSGAFLSYAELVGDWYAWWTLAAINLVGLVVTLLFIKETKGKTLEEIEEMFRTNSCQVCSFSSSSRHRD